MSNPKFHHITVTSEQLTLLTNGLLELMKMQIATEKAFEGQTTIMHSFHMINRDNLETLAQELYKLTDI